MDNINPNKKTQKNLNNSKSSENNQKKINGAPNQNGGSNQQSNKNKDMNNSNKHIHDLNKPNSSNTIMHNQNKKYGSPNQNGHPNKQPDQKKSFDNRNNRDHEMIELISHINIGTNQLNAKLFSDTAMAVAKKISSKGNVNSYTQLRKFYDELVLWQSKIGSNKELFAQSEPFIQMIRAKVAYAKGRKYIDDCFKVMMDNLIKQINSPETLSNAKLFFEAVLGFKRSFE